MSATPAASNTVAATPPDINGEIPLKQAALLVGKNERTLRRKLDEGTLKGRKKPLETGGELWLVDHQSLIEAFGDAATPPATSASPAATPYDFSDMELFSLADSTSPVEPPPPVIVQPKPDIRPPQTFAATPAAAQRSTAATPPATQTPDTPMESAANKPSRTVPDLTDFLIKEHESLKDGHKQDVTTLNTRHREELSSLKEQLEQRDGRITSLQDLNGQLRQELGEVRGRADTETKMREWLQSKLDQVQHQLAARISYAPSDQATPSSNEPKGQVIDVESPTREVTTPARTRMPFPAGAMMGLILFVLLGGVAVAYFAGLFGGQ